ncbi:MAG: Holliday junction branch migration protein RuvA [Acidobacteriota bacterium]
MIGRLRGRVLEAAPGRLVLDVGGVGYELLVSVATFAVIEAATAREPERVIDLSVHTHVREDAIQLFGFAESSEKTLFLALVGVAGVGPKLALNILSGIPGDDLLAALAGSDLPRLRAIPGVGKKTAERLVLELRERARDLVADRPSALTPAPPASGDDLVEALVGLGYARAAAERAAGRQPAGEDVLFAERLRRALRELSRR